MPPITFKKTSFGEVLVVAVFKPWGNSGLGFVHVRVAAEGTGYLLMRQASKIFLVFAGKRHRGRMYCGDSVYMFWKKFLSIKRC